MRSSALLAVTVMALATGCGHVSSQHAPVGSARYVVTGAGALIPADDWWCTTLTDGQTGKMTSEAWCGPAHGQGVSISLNPGLGDAIQLGSDQKAHLTAIRDGLKIYTFSFGSITEGDGLLGKSRRMRRISPSVGLHFPTNSWRCAARNGPPNLTCYQSVGGGAKPPFVLVYSRRRVVEIESASRRILMATAGPSPEIVGGITYTYVFDK